MKMIHFVVTLAILCLALLACAQKKEAILALKGLDPVQLIAGKQVQGKESLLVTEGRFKYLFADEQSMKTFKSDPKKYSLQLDGKCVMSPEMDGVQTKFAVVEGKIYLGGSDMCILAFKSNPSNFVDTKAGTRVAPSPRQGPPRKNVAVLVFEGVQVIDYSGPFEVFGEGGMNPYTVAESEEPITTAMGIKVVPSYFFANCPKPDIMVIPGGNVHIDDPKIIKWIQDTSKDSEYVMSVCNGAFYLAKAGLLDGKSATTFYGLIDGLKELAPTCKVVTDQRFVDNGKIITTAGLSSGIDGALHMIEKVKGFGAAQAVALNMEYDWKPDAHYARASFADAPLRKMLGAKGFDIPADKLHKWTVLKQAGDSNWWQKDWEADLDLSQSELMQLVNSKCAESWKKTAGDDKSASSWSFKDEDGKDWTAEATLTPKSEHVYNLSIKLQKKA